MLSPHSQLGLRRLAPSPAVAGQTVHAGQLLVEVPAGVDVVLGQVEQAGGSLRLGTREDVEPRLLHGELLVVARRLLAVQVEGMGFVAGIEVVQRPVAAVHRFLLQLHAGGHVDAPTDAVAEGDQAATCRDTTRPRG